MSERSLTLAYILLISLAAIDIVYVILPALLGKDIAGYGFCVSLIMVIVGFALGGGTFTMEVTHQGAEYSDAVVAKTSKVERKIYGRKMWPLSRIGLFIGGIGLLLLIGGIIMYSLLWNY